MSTYRRRGHWRRGRNGSRHWVRGHAVSRDSWSGPNYWDRGGRVADKFANSRAQRKQWWNDPDTPNSHCPMCGEPVWFFRNRNGGCAYFDALGKPWPLHPCMELQQRTADRQAAVEAVRLYEDLSASMERPSAETHARPSALFGSTLSRAANSASGRASAAPITARPSDARVSQKPVEDQVLSWWTALSGLIAACLVLLTAGSMVPDAGFFSTILLMWFLVLPSALLGIALTVFVVLVPRPRKDAHTVALQCVAVPVFVLLGVVFSVLTLGIGPAALAIRVIVEVPWARVVASSPCYPAAAARRQ